MAKVYPFRAVRPTRDNVSLVTSRSYEEYAPAELASQLEFNPLSFLHVLHPAYSHRQHATYEMRFKSVRHKYEEFKREGILVKDEKPSIYVHKITTKTDSFCGIILATDIQDLKSDVIKRHEDTISYRVELFKDYMKYSGFNTEPVLMTYPDNPEIENWLAAKTAGDPDFEFSTTRREVHYLWKIDDELEIRWLQDAFSNIRNLYIADGHHRTASAEMLFDENPAEESPQSRFMSFLIADSNVRIYEYNRLVADLNGLDKKAFFRRLSDDFDVSLMPGPYSPSGTHEFGVYLDNDFYCVKLKSGHSRFESALDRLDAKILYDKVLNPILGIEDLRNDERLGYVSGKTTISEIRSKVDNGDCALAFLLYPTGIEEIKEIADAHLIMPPKSTYIEPKFRSGLVVYEL